MKPLQKKFTINIPDEVLINDVIAVAKKLCKNTVTKQEHSEHGIYHPSTFRYRFRTWFNVLDKAGLQPSRSPMNIPEELLFKNLEEVWDRLGKQPTSEILRNKSKAPSQYSGSTYLNRFGSWTNTLKKFIEYQNSKSADEGGQIQNRVKIRKPPKKEINPRRVGFELRFSVLIRDGFRCIYCGKSPLETAGVELHCDHIIPWSKGGKTVIDNLRTLCSRCNLSKSDKL